MHKHLCNCGRILYASKYCPSCGRPIKKEWIYSGDWDKESVKKELQKRQSEK